MCRQPIRITNRNKYLNTKYGQQYFVWVNCGHCDECLREKQNEWTLRTYYQVKDCLDNGEYVYFDTLTYDRKNLPRLNKVTNILEPTYNFPCFDYRDIRNFYETLRGYYKGKDTDIKYFITSEYGDIRGRNHYHIMLFVYDENIDPIKLSINVNKAWGKGRTDGIPWKSKKYVIQHNVIKEMNIDAIKYIAKYVTKPQKWMQLVNARWARIEHYYREKKKYNYLTIKRRKKEYYRFTQPFHRQSQGYGLKALDYQTNTDIWEENRMKYRDNTLKIVKYASLPSYFKRKLFEEQIEVNGKRIWQLTEKGIEYKNFREKIIEERIKDRLKDLATQQGTNLSDTEIEELTQYILYIRGRTAGKQDYRKHLEETEAYNYNTNRDLQNIGRKVISKNFAGNDTIGYELKQIEPIENWEKNIMLEPQKEAILEALMKSKDITQLVLQKEHMREIKKIFFKKA